MTLTRRVAAEGLGTSLLLALVVGSGIMGERLAGGNGAIALLANASATGAGLAALILVFGPISGAHLNPLITMASALDGSLPWRETPAFLLAQVVGALAGVGIAHAMFELPLYAASAEVRSGSGQWIAELIASFGLVLVIARLKETRPAAIPAAVGAYIFAAYWFTASTSFANPAVTLARAFTDTMTGIRLADAFPFMVAQLAGAAAAVFVNRWFGR